MKNEDKKVHLQLTIDELNLVLTALGQLPYVQVAGLIENLCTQAKTEPKENSHPEMK